MEEFLANMLALRALVIGHLVEDLISRPQPKIFLQKVIVRSKEVLPDLAGPAEVSERKKRLSMANRVLDRIFEGIMISEEGPR
ncbi:MAG: hypothetical protein O2807_10390 [bacterium]|nr:hypothetical protein [bacterium]